MRYALHRLWNPRTEKGLLATLRKGGAVKLVADLLNEADEFFDERRGGVRGNPAAERGNAASAAASSRGAKREWTELRIRRPELVQDNVTLPIQRLREAVSELIKLSEDKDIGQELMECNRRLAELREEVAVFLEPERRGLRLLGRTRRQGAEESGAQRRADRRGGISCAAGCSRATRAIIMTSATLATKVGQASRLPSEGASAREEKKDSAAAPAAPARAGETPALLFMPFDPEAPVGIYRRHLPHWRQDGCT